LVAVAHQRRELAHDPVHAVEARGGAFDHEVAALRADADVEQRFEVLEVLVVRAEERFDPFLGNGNPLGAAYLSQFISLLLSYLAPHYTALISPPVSAGLATVWRQPGRARRPSN